MTGFWPKTDQIAGAYAPIAAEPSIDLYWIPATSAAVCAVGLLYFATRPAVRKWIRSNISPSRKAFRFFVAGSATWLFACSLYFSTTSQYISRFWLKYAQVSLIPIAVAAVGLLAFSWATRPPKT